MDKPLLALTRVRRETLATEENVAELAQLRWLAVIGQLAAILSAHFLLGVELPLVPMVTIVATLVVVNLVIAAAPRYTRVGPGVLIATLVIDMLGLTAQLYLSGGTANPFVSLYLLQIALGAILLPLSAATVLAIAATAGFALLSVWRQPLILPMTAALEADDILLLAHWFAFAMVAGLLVLFVTRISRNLRARDAYVAQVRERDAQEEGVLRVGLFASGAAHELGTPLSSLAVLVGDWQDHPAFRADAQLQEELADAAAELQRCKDTVSQVLESAGQARGEAMGTVSIGDLLGGVAEDWAANAQIPLALDLGTAAHAEITADLALRQAIWSLLENAREAHSPRIELVATIDGLDAEIAIHDHGDGFSEDILADLGRPFRSEKGDGRGIGLFLATTVARRLGGKLAAANRADGGATVALRLPVVRIG